MSENVDLPDEHFENNKKNEEIVKKGFWTKVKKVTGKVPFTKEAVSMYYCAIDAKTPLVAKAIAFGALAYFISPLDAIPDALIGLGFTDDAAIIGAAITAIGKNITDEHRDKSNSFFNGGASLENKKITTTSN